jgi:hypothetical protein
VVFICHDRRRIEVWRRDDDSWTHHASDTAVELVSIGARLQVADVFLDPLGDPGGSA